MQSLLLKAARVAWRTGINSKRVGGRMPERHGEPLDEGSVTAWAGYPALQHRVNLLTYFPFLRFLSGICGLNRGSAPASGIRLSPGI